MERIQRKLAAARQQRLKSPEFSVVQAAAARANDQANPRRRRPVEWGLARDTRVWVGMAFTAIVIATLAWMVGTIDTAAEQTRSTFSSLNAQNAQLVKLRARVISLDDSIMHVDDKLTNLQEQVTALSSSILSITMSASETTTKVSTAHKAPVAATEKKNKLAPALDTTSELAALEVLSARQISGDTVNAAHTVMDASNTIPEDGATEVSFAERSSVSHRGKELWVINLASFSDKRDADRFTKHAHSRNVNVEQNQVTVKGQAYWRVQLPGFPSAADAKARAATVEKELGLKETWISRR